VSGREKLAGAGAGGRGAGSGSHRNRFARRAEILLLLLRSHALLVSCDTYLLPVHKWRLMAGYMVAPNMASAAACRRYRPGRRSPETTIIIRSPQKL